MDLFSKLQACCVDRRDVVIIEEYSHDSDNSRATVHVNKSLLEVSPAQMYQLRRSIASRVGNRQELPTPPPGIEYSECAVICIACYEYSFNATTMRVSNEFCEKLWHVLAQVSASCPVDLSNWLQASMDGRCASGYRSSHIMTDATNTFSERLAHVYRPVSSASVSWSIAERSRQDNEGYEYLDDIVSSLMKQV
jgi:hypothetical protein